MELCCSNYHNQKPEPEGYRIGIIRLAKKQEPRVQDVKLVRESAENQLIGDHVENLLDVDFVLVPKTQIHPFTDRITSADRWWI